MKRITAQIKFAGERREATGYAFSVEGIEEQLIVHHPVDTKGKTHGGWTVSLVSIGYNVTNEIYPSRQEAIDAATAKLQALGNDSLRFAINKANRLQAYTDRMFKHSPPAGAAL